MPGKQNKATTGRASIYKGTDKSTNKAGKVAVKKTSTKPVVYGNTNYKPKAKTVSTMRAR